MNKTKENKSSSLRVGFYVGKKLRRFREIEDKSISKTKNGPQNTGNNN